MEYFRRGSITLVFVLSLFLSGATAVSAQPCSQNGGVCRSQVTGCAFPESVLAGTCGDFQICCNAIGGASECTNAGNVCRGDQWSFQGCGPSETPAPQACASVGFQVCCMPEPNIGDPCNSTGTCQMPGNCAGGTQTPSSACIGGSQCCQVPNIGAVCNGNGTCQNPGNCAGGVENISGACINGAVCCQTPNIGGVCVSQDSGNTGICRFSCQTNEAAETPNLPCFGANCCVPTSNVGTACTGDNVGTPGVCQVPSNCPAANTDTSGTCTGGTVCCLNAPPANTGAPCVGDNIGTSGTCQPSTNCPAANTDTSGSCTGGGICCLSAAPPNVGTTCTGDNVGTPGVCQLGSNCSPANTDTSGSCTGGAICCLSAAPTNYGATCTGDNVGTTGTCQPSTNCQAANTDTSGDCLGGAICCLAPTGPNTGAPCVGDNIGTSGTCQPSTNCPAANTDTSGSCTGGGICCLTTGSSSSGGPAPVTCTGSCVPAGGSCPSTMSVLSQTCPLATQMCCGVAPGGAPGTVNFINPLVFSDVNSLLSTVLTFLQRLIVTLSLIFIIVGAFMYISSAGNAALLGTAKLTILGALIGLALGIAAPAFFREIATILGWTGFTAPAGVGTSLSLLQIATNVLSFLLSLIGVVSLIMLIVGAFMYLTAAGDENRIDTGKKIVLYSIIGITVALAALVLVRQVALFFQ
jgi:hypothetical protein